jgi:hypothetical protein
LLPEGIRFNPGTLNGPAANFVDMITPPSIPSALPATVPFRGSNVSLNSDAAYQVFAPDGTLTKQAPVRLRLVEGTGDSGSGIIYTGQQSAGQPLNYYDIIVVRETGQAKVERYQS